MFKKHVTEVNSSPLSGKDVKTLKKDIQTTYRLSEEQVKKLFPSKADLVVQKLSNKAKTFACTGENPLFFDPDGRGNVLLPTIYALWQCPELLPKIYTYSEVSPKVCTLAFQQSKACIAPSGMFCIMGTWLQSLSRPILRHLHFMVAKNAYSLQSCQCIALFI